MIQYNFTPIRF